jgi:hypothetical protein
VASHEKVGTTCLSLQNPLFELPSNLADVIEDQFYMKWKMLTTNLHYAWAFFNPYLLGESYMMM